jgi:hypothetical protein
MANADLGEPTAQERGRATGAKRESKLLQGEGARAIWPPASPSHAATLGSPRSSEAPCPQANRSKAGLTGGRVEASRWRPTQARAACPRGRQTACGRRGALTGAGDGSRTRVRTARRMNDAGRSGARGNGWPDPKQTRRPQRRLTVPAEPAGVVLDKDLLACACPHPRG